MKKRKSISRLKKELDMWFSRYIRWRDQGQCYTCYKQDDPKRMHAGHFVPRQFLATRYNEENVHCQCYACNILYHGQPSAYSLRLDMDYGIKHIWLLESQRKLIIKDFPYEEQIEKFKKLAVSVGWKR